MNILLTGANGFVGSYFKKKYTLNYNIQTFSFLKDNFDSLECENIDTVVHLSALVHQMNGASLDKYENVNVDQTLKLANKAKKSGVKHFIFMSTVKVYGEENEKAYTENSPCRPIDNYGKSKLKAEVELVKLATEEFKVSIIRTPIVYGYGVKANIKSLVKLIKKVYFLPFGGINNQRTMVYIGNLCHLISEIIKQNKSGVFLAADNESLSTTQLILKISKILNKKIVLFKLPFFGFFFKKVKQAFYLRLFCSLKIDNRQTRKELNLENPYSNDIGIKYMLFGEET